MTGTIHVEEVVVLSKDSCGSRAEETKPKHYRRLVFRRNPNLIQSEASLIPVKVYSKERDRTRNGTDVVRRHSGNKKKHKAKDPALGCRTGAYFVVFQLENLVSMALRIDTEVMLFFEDLNSRLQRFMARF